MHGDAVPEWQNRRKDVIGLRCVRGCTTRRGITGTGGTSNSSHKIIQRGSVMHLRSDRIVGPPAEAGCVNAAVCGGTAVGGAACCWRCTLFTSCYTAIGVGAGTCPVCLESHGVLYSGPWCTRHGFCGRCIRRLAFGNSRPPLLRRLGRWVSRNHARLAGARCPMCRSRDDRSASGKLYDTARLGAPGWPTYVRKAVTIAEISASRVQ